MKFSTLASLAIAAPALAAPTAKRALDDVAILQFALTLEHLEDYFYSHALRRIPASAFVALGLDKDYFTKLRYIASDEKSHVGLLTSAIAATGNTPVKECTYTFSDSMTASEFLTLSSVLEGVGTSAYLGGAPLISSKDYLTVAGSILVTEALHTSFQRNAVKEVPFATPYGTPLDPTSIYTLAAAFIKTCPSSASSLKLGLTTYPALTLQPGSAPAPGSTITVTPSCSAETASYLTFVYGLTVTSVPATVSGDSVSGVVPTGAGGQTYVFVTSGAANGTLASAGSIIAGPAIVEVAPAAPCFLSVSGCGVD